MSAKKPQRSFKVRIGDGEAYGRYTGVSPKQAANKAFSGIIADRKQSGGSLTGKVTFTVIESTRGSKKKEYTYVGQRKKLETPVEYTIGKGPDAKTITKRYKNELTKISQTTK